MTKSETSEAPNAPQRLFRDRREAGRILAGLLEHYRGNDDVVVLALPRGGVPVAYEVATALGAPLDVFIVRKLGVPGREELAMGAIATGGVVVLNDDIVRGLDIPSGVIEQVAEDERPRAGPPRARLPRRPARLRRRRQDRDPRRRRSGHRRQHACRSPGAAPAAGRLGSSLPCRPRPSRPARS